MYDLVIIGGGPGGITAGIYAKRALLKTICFEKEVVGGQIAVSDIIENYPGFPSLSGAELAEKFHEHAKAFDLEIQQKTVTSLKQVGKHHLVTLSDGTEIETKAVIISTGAHPRKLGCKGEDEFFGKGVSYCATCDGNFFRNQDVAVIGGGDTAVKDSIYLSRIVNKVELVHRRDELRAEKILRKRVFELENVNTNWFNELKEIKGDKMGVSSIEIENNKTKEITEIPVTGVFIFVGITPNTSTFDVNKDKGGFIITNEKMETNVSGVFAIGDCRVTPLMQVATAVGDGAIAAFIAGEYIETL